MSASKHECVFGRFGNNMLYFIHLTQVAVIAAHFDTSALTLGEVTLFSQGDLTLGIESVVCDNADER